MKIINLARSGSHTPYEQPREESMTALPPQIAISLSIDTEGLDRTPFHQKGGIGKAFKLFSERLPKLLKKLNEALAA